MPILNKLLAIAAAAGMVAAPCYASAQPTQAARHQQAANSGKAKAYRPLIPVKRSEGKRIPGLSSTPAHLTLKHFPRRAAAKAQVSEGLQLRGSVVSTWSFMRFPGYYTIPCTTDADFEQIGGVVAEYGAWDDGNGKMYVAGLYDYGFGFVVPELYVYNTDTWEEEDPVANPAYSILATDNAEDPTTGEVYGCFYDEYYENLTWAKADYAAGESQAIRTLDESERMFGVAADAAGQFYGLLADGSFVKVDKTTGAFTTVGDTGLHPFYISGATFDDRSGQFIFSYAPATGNTSLWTINPSTAQAELLIEYADNDQITALTAVKPAADNAAPAAPTIVAAAPDGGKDIHYTVTMPTTLYDGTPADGTLNWYVLINSTQVASGVSAYGGQTESIFTAKEDGMYTLTTYVENEVGRSPSAKVVVAVGAGVPKAPEGLGINNFGDGTVSLYWDAVTESVGGAYVDPAAITYTVSCNGEVLAEGIKDSWFDDAVSVTDTYVKLNYEVRAVFAGKESEAAAVSTGVGAIKPPYACSFSSKPFDDGIYTTLNSNNDDTEWYFSEYYGCFKYDYSANAGDDWLITPAFALEAGKIYEFTYSIAAGHTSYKERYALAMGVAPSAAAMVTQLVAPADLSGDLSTPTVKTVTITVPTSGNYYIGWHALSDPQQFMIQVKDISMSAAMAGGSPAEATDIVLTRDPVGYLKLSGSFKAPAVDISGNALSTVSRITVSREGKEQPVAEFQSVAPGATLTFEDTDIPEIGTYTYTITATGSGDALGRVAKASAYVGPVAPADVTGVRLVEDASTPGLVDLSWEAPTVDVEGNDLIDANLTYMVYVSGDYNKAVPVLDAPVAERQLKIKVCEPSEMSFATFYVSAFNLGLEGSGLTRSAMVPVGKAETLPFRHSFNEADRKAHLLGYVLPAGGGSVEVGNKESDNILSQDGDDAFLKLYSYGEESSIDWFTGKISLDGVDNPAAMFYYYKMSENDRNTIDVMAVDREGNETFLSFIDNAETGNTGWNLAAIPLDKVKGKEVKILIRANFVTHNTFYFDNLTVSDRKAVDLAAVGISAPERVEAEKPFAVTVTIANLGADKAANYKVELSCNGSVAATAAEVPVLVSGEQATVMFDHMLTPVDGDECSFFATVTVTGDEDPTNNISPVATPTVVKSKFPAVANLAAERTAAGVSLAWSAPSTEGFDVKEVEDFEDATAWTEEVEGWTMLDIDGKQIGTLEGAGLPDAVAMRTTHSFFVFDSESEDVFFYNPELAYLVKGNSGSKSLVAMYILPMDTQQDDWAISPLLSGEAQTVSFYARSFHPDYLDRMEVLYATDDTTDPAAFISLGGSVEVPQLVDAVGNASYKEFSYALPAGAKHFAIRATNDGGSGFMLMIDDVKFRQANATLQIVGYDIYRDGTKLNSEPVGESSFVDTDADGEAHTYNVVVRYNRGISPASNSAGIGSGVGAVAGSSVTVIGGYGTISVSGTDAATAVAVYSVDGRQLGAAAGNARFEVAPGTYLVTVGSYTTKVVVK